jgi:hypothetical protein
MDKILDKHCFPRPGIAMTSWTTSLCGVDSQAPRGGDVAARIDLVIHNGLIVP